MLSNDALKGLTAHAIIFTPHVLSGICWFCGDGVLLAVVTPSLSFFCDVGLQPPDTVTNSFRL